MSGTGILREERIGNQRLILGDCLQVMPGLGRFDAVVTDPPYSERTHVGHLSAVVGQASEGKDGFNRKALGYCHLTDEDCRRIARLFDVLSSGWIVWFTDHSLAPAISAELERLGRYVFAPLPFYMRGRSVRLTGDGPCSWTDWIVVARTAAQHRWGTLPGGYIAGPGWAGDRARMGGKPLQLMVEVLGDYTRQGDAVLDPFMGAGTTIAACERLGRHGTGIEVDPVAFKIACRRVDEAARQPALFHPVPPPAPVQEGFDL